MKITIRQTAAILDRTVSRVHQLIAEGKIKGEKIAPGLWMVDEKSVKKYLKKTT